MFETVFIQYGHIWILGEMILFLAPRSLDKQLAEERASGASAGSGGDSVSGGGGYQ